MTLYLRIDLPKKLYQKILRGVKKILLENFKRNMSSSPSFELKTKVAYM